MRSIFVSYRRDDAEGEAGRLFDDLVAQFGEDSVFMDVAAIEVGRDFRKAIDDSVATCGVLLAIIGRDWIDAKNASGQRRLDDPSDFVRLETASALKRDIPVVPVLVHGAKMPSADQLPDGLKELAYRNGVEVTHARWNSDIQLLFKALRPLVGESKAEPAPQPAAKIKPLVPVESKAPAFTAETSPTPTKKPMGIILAVVAAVLVVGAIGGYMMFASGKGQEEQRAAAEQKALADNVAADRPAAQAPSTCINGTWHEGSFDWDFNVSGSSLFIKRTDECIAGKFEAYGDEWRGELRGECVGGIRKDVVLTPNADCSQVRSNQGWQYKR